MPPASRITDTGSGHPGCGTPTNVIEGSPNVIIGGQPAMRKGDALAPHCKHDRHGKSGSSTVFINSKDAMRIGDPIDCGGSLITGFASVIFG